MKRLWAVCLALTLILCGYQLWRAAEPSPAPPSGSPTPAPTPAPVLAFFGSSAGPWQEELLPGAAAWCDREGWELVEYDCMGLADTQALQVDDLAGHGGADLAVLCSVSRASLEENAATLASRGVRVLTFSDSPLGALERPQGSLAHLGPDSDETLRAAAAFFQEALTEDTGVVILHDMETDPLEASAGERLTQAGVTVLEETYTWGSVDFAQLFLADALARHGDVGGVLTFSRTGAQGARAALDAAEREEVKILCMDCGDELLADLAEGRLEGVMTLSRQGTAAQLQDTLSHVAAGKTLGSVPLGMEVRKK